MRQSPRTVEYGIAGGCEAGRRFTGNGRRENGVARRQDRVDVASGGVGRGERGAVARPRNRGGAVEVRGQGRRQRRTAEVVLVSPILGVSKLKIVQADCLRVSAEDEDSHSATVAPPRRNDSRACAMVSRVSGRALSHCGPRKKTKRGDAGETPFQPSPGASAASSSGMSSAHCRRNPTVSIVGALGFTPSTGTRPWLGLNPTMPQNAAGRITDPRVCVPRAAGTMKSATAAAEPLDEPPGV